MFVLFFGARRIPEIGASIGKGIREFKNSLREPRDEEELPPPPPSAPMANRGEGEPKRLNQ